MLPCTEKFQFTRVRQEGHSSNLGHQLGILTCLATFHFSSHCGLFPFISTSITIRKKGCLRMPSREATMPPTLPYPYSSNEEISSSPSDSPELSVEDVISEPVIKPTGSASSVERHQGNTRNNSSSNSCDRGTFSYANETREIELKCLHHHWQRNHSSNSTKGGHTIEAGAFTSLFNSSFSEIHETALPSALDPSAGAFAPQGAPSGLIVASGKPLGLPGLVFARIIFLLDRNSLLNTRATARQWLEACDRHRPLQFSPLYRLPVELIQLILAFTSPSSFNAARHVCRAWNLSSLEPSLLRSQLKSLGFYHADHAVRNSQSTRYLSTRLSREFSLGAGGLDICGLRKTTIIDLSNLAATSTVHFTVSICGSYALLSEGCVVYVYRLQATIESRIEFVASVICPRRVLAVSMDTSSRRFAIAILLVSPPLICPILLKDLLTKPPLGLRMAAWDSFTMWLNRKPKALTGIYVVRRTLQEV